MLVLVAATAARSAQAVMEETGRRSTAGGFDCDGIGARDVHTNTRASQADRRFFQGQRSAEHVLAMDKRATDRLPEMKHDAEAVRACDVSPFANAPGVAPISGAPSFHATSDTEVFVCPAARLAFIHIFKCAGTTLIASMHDLCRATYGDEGFCVQESSSPWFCRGGPTRTMEEEWANIQSYTWFTFVREPVSKFESGIFELARRNA